MTAEPSDATAPVLLLVGGGGDAALSMDAAIHALREGRDRGLVTVQTNHADTLVETKLVAEWADTSWPLDHTNPEACAAWIKERTAAGDRFDVVIGVRELAQVGTAMIAEAVDAAGNPPEVVHTVRNKDLARAKLAAAGFQQPAFRLCADRAEAAAFLGSSTGPWVVKPRDGMGSEGVRKVSGLDELDVALGALHKLRPFLVEQFIEGVEYSVEGLFLGGAPRVLAVTAKQVVDPPYFVEVGHVIPAPMAEVKRAEATEQVEAALRLLGARFGIFHVELWITEAGVVLGELHVRNGGDWIHRLLEYAIPGLQLYGLVYDDALGRPVDTTALTPTRAAAVRFLLPPVGTLERIEGWEQVTAHPAVLHASLEITAGDRIEAIHDSDTRAGAVIVGARTPEEAEAIARQLVESVKFVVHD